MNNDTSTNPYLPTSVSAISQDNLQVSNQAIKHKGKTVTAANLARAALLKIQGETGKYSRSYGKNQNQTAPSSILPPPGQERSNTLVSKEGGDDDFERDEIEEIREFLSSQDNNNLKSKVSSIN